MKKLLFMPRSRPEAVLQLGLLRLARHGEGVLVVLALAVHTNVPAILLGYITNIHCPIMREQGIELTGIHSPPGRGK